MKNAMKIATTASLLVRSVTESRRREECMTFDSSSPAEDIVESVLKAPNSNVKIRNVRASNHACFKRFTNGHITGKSLSGEYMIFDEGVLLSTGEPGDFCWNNAYNHTHVWGAEGDADLTSLVKTSLQDEILGMGLDLSLVTLPQQFTYDACEIEVEFRCFDNSPQISLGYIFGSEEYFGTGGSEYEDVFAIFLNGKNIALLPNGEQVSISNVNHDKNSKYFIRNGANDTEDGPPYPMIEADGFTTKLTARGSLRPRWNVMKIAIADRADAILDSYVLLEGASLTCTGGGGAGGRAPLDETPQLPLLERKMTTEVPPHAPFQDRTTAPATEPSRRVPPLDEGGTTEAPPQAGPRDRTAAATEAPPRETPSSEMAAMHDADFEPMPESVKRWYPNLNGPENENPYSCIYGSDYSDWMNLPDLRVPFLFDTEEDCCLVHTCEDVSGSQTRRYLRA